MLIKASKFGRIDKYREFFTTQISSKKKEQSETTITTENNPTQLLYIDQITL